LSHATAWCGDGLSAVGDSKFDVVLCNPPVRAGNAVIAQLFEDAHRALKTGGTLWVVLRTAQGAKSWARRLEESWGNCETVTIEQGYRILRSVK
jgi:16S rRNA (guanine1207-N2)-methyltransferase